MFSIKPNIKLGISLAIKTLLGTQKNILKLNRTTPIQFD